MRKTKKEIKAKIIELLADADYLSDDERDNWLKMLDILSFEELREVYGHFSNSNKNKDKYVTKLIYEEGLEEEYKNELDSLSKKHIKKSEQRERELENPGDLLKQLDTL